MKKLFESYRPESNIRQPRIQYRVDDPSMAVLEELRQFGGYRKMSALYLQALKLGAEMILRRAAQEGIWQRGDGQTGLSPVKVQPAKASRPAPPKPDVVVPVPVARSVALPVASPAPVQELAQVSSPAQELVAEPSPAPVASVSQERSLSALMVPDIPMPPPRRVTNSAAAEAQFAQFGD